MTRNAHGNEPAALFNSTLGNMLGTFISPALVVWTLGMLGTAPSQGSTFNYGPVFLELGLTVLLPLLVGQVVRFVFPDGTARAQDVCKLRWVSSAALLLLLWVVFCDLFANADIHMNAGTVVLLLLLDVALYLGMSGLIFAVSRLPLWSACERRHEEGVRRFSRADSVAIVMCGGTKTVAMGIQILSVLFARDPQHTGLITLPLIMYHALQLVLGAIAVPNLKTWVDAGEAGGRVLPT